MQRWQIAVLLSALAAVAGIARSDDAVPDTAAHSMTLNAVETIKDENGREDVRPLLSFHCQPGNEAIAIGIDWGRFISSFNTDIGFKVDGGRTLWQKWGVDQSNTITSSSSDADSAALIDYIGSGKLLAVDIAPYAGSPIVVHFDLAGFSGAIDELRAGCS